MTPWFLIVKTPTGVPVYPPAVARGEVLAAGGAERVTPLEPGTRHTGLIILRFAFEEDLHACWQGMAPSEGSMALACAGLPFEGWPGDFVPTIATVDVPNVGAPRCFMLIEGSTTDPEGMTGYRDIILPMMRERGAYYTLFEIGGNVRVLAGEWTEGILAISRWPSRAQAEDFWNSERYQKEAVPIRTPIGRFEVQIIEGAAG